MNLLLTILLTIPIMASKPTTEFDLMNQNVTPEERMILEMNDIASLEDFEAYLEENESWDFPQERKKSSNGESIDDIDKHLKENYSQYRWYYDFDGLNGLTSDVSNAIPEEMKSTNTYTSFEWKRAIEIANIERWTNYGGCAPIATVGILDYFARYLGYNEIISDTNNLDKRIILITEVLTRTNFSVISLINGEETLVWPSDSVNSFNNLMKTKKLDKVFKAQSYKTQSRGFYWDKIVESIDNGIPVTLFNGNLTSDEAFAQHYTNVYGYETWFGIDEYGNFVEKQFLKARLNWGEDKITYCDADILDSLLTGIITYDIKHEKSENFYANDFSKDFINAAGQGQYFFNNIKKDLKLSNGTYVSTNRLRTSYIEDKYLILSPSRANAGTAYLDIEFPHSVSRIDFGASMWSSLEGQRNQKFKIQYMDYYTGWKDHVTIDLEYLTTVRDYPDMFKVLLPKKTTRIRFITTVDNPSGDRNKGRVVLNNFKVQWN